MNREEKAARVEELAEKIGSSPAMFLADYRGLTVAEASELRNEMRRAGAVFQVVKNSLMERAADQASVPDLKQFLEGPTAVAFCPDEGVAAAKVLTKFAKELKPLQIKGGILDGEAVDLERIEFLASLPSLEELQAKLVGMLQSPLRGLAGVCAGPMRGLVTVLGRVREQKEAEAA